MEHNETKITWFFTENEKPTNESKVRFILSDNKSDSANHLNGIFLDGDNPIFQEHKEDGGYVNHKYSKVDFWSYI